jgi:hypothetical protein
MAEAALELGDGETALAAARRLAEATVGGEEHRSAIALVGRVADRFGRSSP